MTLDELIRELSALDGRGYGGYRVIDQDMNDVMEVSGPIEDLPEDEYPDTRTVMLSCWPDHSAVGGPETITEESQ